MYEGKLSDCGTVRVIMAGETTGEEFWLDLPCQWKAEGLAVVDVSGVFVRDGEDVKWHRPSAGLTWGVTHLASGRNIGPRHRTADKALAVALGLTQLGVDWTQNMDSVKTQVEANATAAGFIVALHHGRVVMAETARA